MTTGVLLTDVARDAVLVWLKAQLPAQIAGVNADRPTKHPLDQIASWTGSPLVATPEPPALYVLPQTSGFRGTQLAVNLDEAHKFLLYVQVGNQDEEYAQQDLMGYLAAIIRCVLLHLKSEVPIGNGAQLLFGHGGGDAADVLVYGPSQMTEMGYYQEAYLLVTLIMSEPV